MIKLTQHAEDVEEKLSIDNTKVVVPVVIQEQKLEDVINNLIKFR